MEGSMNSELRCYRCGTSLKALSLPLSRLDECPECSVALHVCRQCEYYDPRVPRQCREDGAEDVTEKSRVNFCDWFRPGLDVFDGREKAAEDRAKEALEALFGDASSAADDKRSNSDLDDLFK
jgi:hypothetical protein